jgi:hypothetical protein
MGSLTSQKINDYYARYKSVEASFNREVIQITGLVSSQVQLKCGSDFFPCIIYSTSFEGARVIANLKSGILARLAEMNNSISLKFCFRLPATQEQVAFFVSTASKGYNEYTGAADQGIFTLQYKQRPPDDLIEIMGRVLDANFNFSKRKDDRLLLSADVVRKLKVQVRDVNVTIAKVPRRCILRDLAFGGARLVIAGIPKFLVDKDVELSLDFDEPKETIVIKGKFTGSEPVAGRNDLVVMLLEFTEASVPMAYKLRISDYLGTVALRSTQAAPSTAASAAPVAAQSKL